MSRSESETAALAADLAGIVAGEAASTPAVILLSGNLGTGKSVFARAFIRTLCADPDLDVPSPTFTLVQHYETPTFPIRHFDLNRLESPEEIYETGWEEAITEGVTLVEWPERLGNIIVDGALDIHITAPSDDTRCIIINNDADNISGSHI